MKWILITLILPAMVRADPVPPATRQLGPSEIQTVPIHFGMDTLLMFPEPVTLIAGKGLTSGEGQGAVHFQQAENPQWILLRQIQPGIPVLMHVVMGAEGYSFRLVGSDRPASIIRYVKEAQATPAAAIPEAELRHQPSPVGRERQAQLLKLALGEPVLRAKLPEEYSGYRSVASDVTSEIAGLQIRVARVARFNEEDAVAVIADVRSEDGGRVDLASSDWRIQVGENRVYRPNHSAVHGDPDKGRVILAFLLIGDGNGRPLHLSPENRFAITPRQPNPPQTP
jgi:hypothetical protein